MKSRLLGSTGIRASVIGLGTVKFGRTEGLKFPDPFTLPGDAEIDELLGIARDAGLNLLDTAPAYGTSEERLGRALRGQRHHWVVATKAGEIFERGRSRFDFSFDAIVESAHRSLQRLQTDYVDILVLHSDGNDIDLLRKGGAFDALEKLKRDGIARAIGISIKTIAGGLAALPRSDLLMVPYSAAHPEHETVIREAAASSVGILVKKALDSGHLSKTGAADAVAKAIRFVLETPGVTSAVIGTITPAHLLQGVEAAERCADPAPAE